MARNPEVDAFVSSLDHPLEPGIQAVRDVVLGVDPRITETIKWKSPTFMFEGNIASIEPRSKKHVSLMFHQGAKLPGKHPGASRAAARPSGTCVSQTRPR